jgi:hypothetical protein
LVVPDYTKTVEQYQRAFVGSRVQWDPEACADIIHAAYESIENIDLTSQQFKNAIAPAIVDYINNSFAYISGIGCGVQFVMKFYPSDSHNPTFAFYSDKGLELALRSSTVNLMLPHPNGPNAASSRTAKISPYDIWTSSPRRLKFDDVTNDPNCMTPSRLNMYCGNAIRQEDCVNARFLTWTNRETGKVITIDNVVNHIHHVICAGNDKMFAFVMQWMATLVKVPGARLRTVLFFVGEEGCGKDMIVDCLGTILGTQSAMSVSSIVDLKGNFNQLLFGKRLFTVTESGAIDGQAERSMKALATDMVTRYEAKFQAAFMANNYVNLIILSNEMHRRLLPNASSNSRRWVMSESDPTITRNTPNYFNDLFGWFGVGQFGTTAQDCPGVRAFADYLYNEVDITNFKPTEIPTTARLSEERNNNPVHLWWRECLSAGALVGEESGPIAVENWSMEDVDIGTTAMIRSFIRYCATNKIKGEEYYRVDTFYRLMLIVLGQTGIGHGNKDGSSVAVNGNSMRIPRLQVARELFNKKYENSVFYEMGAGKGGSVLPCGCAPIETFASHAFPHPWVIDQVRPSEAAEVYPQDEDATPVEIYPQDTTPADTHIFPDNYAC